VPIKINFKTISIEEACCDELLSIKDDIKIFDSGNIQGHPSKTHLFLVVILESGTKMPLFFCPSCGKNLECNVSLKEIRDQVFQKE